MEQRDIELIKKYETTDEKLARLYKQHVDFERQLEELNRKHILSADEELERKLLQKKKLLGRDQMEMILDRYRRVEQA